MQKYNQQQSKHISTIFTIIMYILHKNTVIYYVLEISKIFSKHHSIPSPF